MGARDRDRRASARVTSPSRSPRCSTRRAALARRARAPGCRSAIAVETTTSAPSGTFAASWPIAGSMPASRSALDVARLGPVGPGDLGAERARDEREPAHPGAPDADEVQPAAGPWRRAQPLDLNRGRRLAIVAAREEGVLAHARRAGSGGLRLRRRRRGGDRAEAPPRGGESSRGSSRRGSRSRSSTRTTSIAEKRPRGGPPRASGVERGETPERDPGAPDGPDAACAAALPRRVQARPRAQGRTVETREERIGDLDMGVLEVEARDFTSSSYFFTGDGQTWQVECIADAEHRGRDRRGMPDGARIGRLRPLSAGGLGGGAERHPRQRDALRDQPAQRRDQRAEGPAGEHVRRVVRAE